DGEREQREQLAAHAGDAEDDGAEHQAQRGGQQNRGRQRGKEWPAEAAGQKGRAIDAGAEEGTMAEREIAGIARQDVPRDRQDHPVEQQIEKGFIQGRHADPGQCSEDGTTTQDAEENSPVHDYTFPGRNSSMRISKEKETSGAQDGAKTAMANASLTPTMMPATRGPRALPSPPSITTAKTTPTQAKIWVGVRVKVSAKQMPATLDRATQTPARISESARWLMPKAAAIGP